MGFLNSSVSFTRFKIVDELPQDFWNKVAAILKQFRFHDIDNVPEERSFGWVCFDDMLDAEWITASPYKGSYLVFSLRIDTRRIPAGVIKKHLNVALKEEKTRLAEQNKTYVSRERKKEIKEQVILMLRQRFLPVPAEINVIWNMANNAVWLASTQSAAVELFIDYFKSSFDLHLEPMTPFNMASNLLDEAGLSKLDRLEATQFVANH